MKKNITFLSVLIFSLVSCSEGQKNTQEQDPSSQGLDSSQLENNESAVSFIPVEAPAAFPDAILELYAPLQDQVFQAGKVPFEFNIKNFPFDEDASGRFKLLLSFNGDDPIGFRSPIFQQVLEEGTYRVVGYLVDEDGLALKSFGNFVDRDFQVGSSRPFPDSDEPYLAVNLPRNQQEMLAGEALIIDFLVLGGDMKLDGLEVRIEIGEEHAYQMDRMAPVMIKNLSPGEYFVKISLLRTDGSELDGPFSTVSKTVILR